MNSRSLSGETMNYRSVLEIESQTCRGVRFTISRMSFGKRIELAKRVREIAHKLEFFRASEAPQDSVEAALINGEVDRACLDWGLVKVDGLEIDGEPAKPDTIGDAGPEELCREIIAAIKHECGLTEAERKN
jgi:hypothetical protein